MELELIETQDNGKRVVPYNTGRVQIGRCWQPKLTAAQASCGSRHTKSRSGVAKWGAVSLFAVLAVFLMAVRHG